MRYLVLLEQKLQHETVSELRKMDSPEAEFHVVVPARPLSEKEKEFVSLELAGSADEETEGDETAVLARWRLRDTMNRLEESGFSGQVVGELGRADPIDAAEDALRGQDYDSVVVVTSRPGVVGWLHLDTASKLERKLDIPVRHIEASARQRA